VHQNLHGKFSIYSVFGLKIVPEINPPSLLVKQRSFTFARAYLFLGLQDSSHLAVHPQNVTPVRFLVRKRSFYPQCIQHTHSALTSGSSFRQNNCRYIFMTPQVVHRKWNSIQTHGKKFKQASLIFLKFSVYPQYFKICTSQTTRFSDNWIGW